MAKRNHPRRCIDHIDPCFDEMVDAVRKRIRVVGHGRVFVSIEVDDEGHVVEYEIAANRLTTKDLHGIISEPPKGPR
jgi:hypothetical protein